MAKLTAHTDPSLHEIKKKIKSGAKLAAHTNPHYEIFWNKSKKENQVSGQINSTH